jgi:hypothetical protein
MDAGVIPLLLSDITWSSSNNVASFLGMDATINFWFGLFSGRIGNYFDSLFSGVSAKRGNGFAFRRDGGIAALFGNKPRAITFQHFMFANDAAMPVLEFISVFVPDAPLTLSHYGTLLMLTPDGGTPFLLRSSSLENIIGGGTAPAARGWTRGGGTAEPVYPSSTVPSFPSGGLHIDRGLSSPSWQNSTLASLNITGPVDCKLSEVSPTGAFLIGVSRASLLQLTLKGTGLGLSGATVLVTDGNNSVAIAAVLSATEGSAGGGRSGAPRVKITTVLIDTAGGLASPVRLRQLANGPSVETLAPVAGQPGYLSTTGSAAPYAAGDPLRLSQTGAVVGSALVQRLEAQIQIDAQLPALTGLTLTTASAVPPGVPNPATVATPTTLTIAAGATVPATNSLILVLNAAASLAVMVGDPQPAAGGATTVTLDRALPAALTGAVNWQPIIAANQLGTAAASTAGAANITYVPLAPHSAPAGNFVRIDAAGGVLTVRAVTGLTYDALVLGAALPGAPAQPYSVERFAISGTDQPGLRITAISGVGFVPALNPGFDPTKVTGAALRIVELNGASVAQVAGNAGTQQVPLPGPLTVAGSTLTLSITVAPVNAWAAPSPGQLMLLKDAAATQSELAVVTSLALTVPIDRAWAGAASGLEAVPLVSGSPAYDATPPAVMAIPLKLTLANTIGTGTITVEMPRFNINEIVLLSWTNSLAAPPGTPTSELYRVLGVEQLTSGATVLVDSTTLTLDSGAAPPPGAASFTVTRQVATDPLTGGSRDGVQGTSTNLAGNPALQFNVWRPRTLVPSNTLVPALNGYAITDGTTALPVRFLVPTPATPRTLTVQLGGPLKTITAPAVNLFTPAHVNTPPPAPGAPAPPPLSGALSASFSFTPPDRLTYQIHPDDNFVVNTPTGNLLVAQFYTAGGVTGAGTLDTGTVLIPDETTMELTTKEAVVEHEMRHTWQSQAWGPLLFCILPQLPFVEKVYPGLGLPEYTPYFPVTLHRDGDGALSLHPNDSSVSLSKGNLVEIGTGRLFEIGDTDSDGNFKLLKGGPGDSLEAGTTLYARKENNTGAGLNLAKFFGKKLLNSLSIGAVLELLVVGTWGSLIYGVARCAYAIKRAVTDGGGTTYPAKIEKGASTITLGDDAGKAALKDASRVIVKQSKPTDFMTVRDVTKLADATLTLSAPVGGDIEGDIQVAPYATHTPASDWDWNSYYPATVPDDNKPATVKVLPADKDGKDILKLQVQDEVWIRDGNKGNHTFVTSVNNADGTYELEDRPIVAFANKPTEFQIAKIASNDPLGSIGGTIARKMGASWVRYMIDPFAAVMDALPTTDGSFWNWVARVVRWICSTRAWTLPVGWWVIDNLPRQAAGNGYLAQMEQDASSNSGDLYSSLARLPDAPALVGDVGRYFLFPNGRFSSQYGASQLDTPGVLMPQNPRVIPFFTAELLGGNPPNNGAGAPAVPPGPPFPAGPGDALPDALVQKTAADPRGAPLANPTSFGASAGGFIPASPRLERTNGIYVAFTQPGAHRITLGDTTISDAANARNAQNQGAGPFGWTTVPIFFNQTVGDLTAVTMAGQAVSNGATVTLVLTQRAPITVLPKDTRNYALTVPAPKTDPLLLASDATTLVAQNALAAPATRAVELCRIYRFDAKTKKFDDPVLNNMGMHLAGDLRIPVRRFTVQVTDKIAARKILSISPGDDIQTVSPGQDAWVLVPAAIVLPLSITVSYTPALPDPHQDPAPVISAATVPAALKQAAGDGGGFQIQFGTDDPPEQPADLALSVDVGVAGSAATLTGSLKLNPWFVLTAAGFNVAPGGTLVLNAFDLSSPPLPINLDTVAPIDGATITPSGSTITIKMAPEAKPGTRRVLAWLASDPTKKAARSFTVG